MLGFLTFSGGVKRGHWEEKDEKSLGTDVLTQYHLSHVFFPILPKIISNQKPTPTFLDVAQIFWGKYKW